MKKILFFLTSTLCYQIYSQSLPPKNAYSAQVTQLHSGHSLTDPLFYPHWPGLYVNLIGHINGLQGGQLFDSMVGKSTIPGSNIRTRWENQVGYGAPDARLHIANWEILIITERVPLLYEGGSTQQWYLEGIKEQKNYLSLFVNNAWEKGNKGKGTPTLLWTTWTNIDDSNGPWRKMLDTQGAEFERMQDYANLNRPVGSPPVYIIPGHKMMARLYDDIQLGLVPEISSIKQFFSDNIHINELGAYASSMIHYACIFNKNPTGLPNNLIPNAPSNTPIPSQALANYLQTMVWNVVTNYPRTGISTNQVILSNLGNETQQQLTVYPNPANDLLYLTVDPNQPLDYTIYDSIGNMITKGTENPINISTLISGCYVLDIRNQRIKFIKN